jgi:hypothetical protein
MTLAVTRFINFPIDSRTQKIKSRRFPCSQSYLPLSVASEIHEQRPEVSLLLSELNFESTEAQCMIELLADVFRQHRFRRFVGFFCLYWRGFICRRSIPSQPHSPHME